VKDFIRGNASILAEWDEMDTSESELIDTKEKSAFAEPENKAKDNKTPYQ